MENEYEYYEQVTQSEEENAKDSVEAFSNQSVKPISDTVSKKNKIASYILGILIGILIGLLLALLCFSPKNMEDPIAAVNKYADDETVSQNTTFIYKDTEDVSSIVEACMDSIVAVTSTMNYQEFNFFTGLRSYDIPSSGSGIIVDKSEDRLYIATNNHVIEDSDDLTVEFSNGASAPAFVNGSSANSDVAIITVKLDDIEPETKEIIKVATLHTEDDLKVGNKVIAIGNALGYGQSVTVGYISALNRTIRSNREEVTGLIQTDAAINPGNSGGALINMNGEVIGINVAKYASTDVEGIGYSIPISKIKSLISTLSQEKIQKEQRGYLGIQCTTVDQEMSAIYNMPRGVYVYRITNDALSNQGLYEKDIITAVDGHQTLTAGELTDFLEYYAYGTDVLLSIQRIENGKYIDKDITVTLVEKAE